ncbi:transcriptional adaptor 3 isoform X2 [Lycorma delicatula]|uniref:transcriptional adaptor 3 isoform X2 n=1 Tax=Lycorma delicatula TaxID=130591 RepID=UPI003F50F806
MKHSSKKGLKQKEHSRGAASGSVGGSSSSNFKGKEARLPKVPDTAEECTLAFPDLRIVDKNKLHCYSSILSKSKEEMIGMDDLDNLQLELETLLSAVSVRIRDLQGEIVTLTNTDERIKDKKGKLTAGKTMLTKKVDDKSVVKVSKPVKDTKLTITSAVPPIKTKSKSVPPGVDQDVLPENILPDPAVVTDQTKVVVPKNDTPNKFWAYVEAYCSEITADDVKYLEDLIASCEKDAEMMKIPPLGKHYTLRWAEEDLAEERDASAVVKLKRKSTDSSNITINNNSGSGDNQLSSNNNSSSTGASGPKELLKKAEKLCARERIPGPLTQRLISALLEENINITPLQDSGNKLKVEKQSSVVPDQDENPAKRQKLDSSSNATVVDSKGENAVPNYVKKLPLYHTSVCFERRIRRGLEAAGFLDSQQPQEENDEILKEIKKCQEELRNCALHNIGQLKHVLKLAQAEVARNQVRKKLRQTDAEIVEIYRRMAAAKLKKKQVTKKEREQAWKVLKDRETWQKHFESLPSGLLT